jgi:hypothetical protein
MIVMKMGEKNRTDVNFLDARARELAIKALTRIDQIVFAVDRQQGRDASALGEPPGPSRRAK